MSLKQYSHQVLRTVKLMCSGGTSCYKRLEHAAHHHSLHALGQRLISSSGEVVPETSFVCKDNQVISDEKL